MVRSAQSVLLLGLVISHSLALPPPPIGTEGVADDGDYDDDEDGIDVFLRQTRKHARPMFYINCGYRDLCYCYSKLTRHHYCCSCDVGACFPAHAHVATPGGGVTAMRHLRTGDHVLAVDDEGEIVTTPILGFMDRRPQETALYLTVKTALGSNLTLSPNHVLFKSDSNSSQPITVFGSDISVGDVIYSANDTGLHPSLVIGIEYLMSKGAYVPLTKEGTLIVDGIFVSCYASYKHSLAHAFLAPVRALPFLLQPRPGVYSRWIFYLKNIANSVMRNLCSIVYNISGSSAINPSLAATLADDDKQAGGEVSVTCHQSTQTCGDTKNEEGPTHHKNLLTEIVDEQEGEAYFVSLVKGIGWLLFQEDRAPFHVFQVDSAPKNSGLTLLKFPEMMMEELSDLARVLPRSW